MKYFYITLVLLLALGFATRTVPAYATAASPPSEATLDAGTAQTLSQTLSALRSLLEVMDAEIKTAPLNPSRAAVMSVALGEIGKGLSLIDATLRTKAIAYVRQETEAAPPAVTAEASPQNELPSLAASESETALPQLENSAAPASEDAAETAIAAESGKFLGMPWWASLLAIVLIVGFFVWLWDRREDAIEEAVAPVAPTPRMPIIQEKSVNIAVPLEQKTPKGASLDY